MMDAMVLGGGDAALLAGSVLGPEGEALMGLMRTGALVTAGGVASIAVMMRLERCAGCWRAVLVVVVLLAQAQWSVRRISVAVDEAEPKAAGRMLRDLVPDMLEAGPDGAVLVSGAEGVVAEVRVVSGRLGEAVALAA